jgi:hypothetical protein
VKLQRAWCLIAGVLLAALHLAFAQFPGGGSGTEGDPYLVSSAEHLNAIRTPYLGSLGSPLYYRQTADIDLSGFLNWEPIGSSTIPAYVNYAGASNRISNLTITRSSESGVGLFGKLAGSIQDLALDSGSVTANSWGGSLVGFLDGGTIQGCRSTVSVSGSSSIGGLVGWNEGGALQDSCYRTGSVEATGSYAGGLVGYNGGTVDGCYAAGSVSAGTFPGGLVGWAGGGASVAGSYWDTTVSGQAASAGSVSGGILTSNMMQRATFSGWDFSTQWQLYESNSYPYLEALAEDTAAPVFDPAGGAFVGESVTVTASCATAGSMIHYTTNGVAPTDTSASIASGGSVAVPLPGTLRAVAWVAYRNPSLASSATYTTAEPVALPQFSPGAGSYAGAMVTVTVVCSTASSTLRYTLDGADPTEATSNTVANGGTVEVPLGDPGTTLKVRAYRADLNPSDVATAVYSSATSVGAPVFTPAGGAYVGSSVAVTVTCNTASADIWYTTDGSEPAVSNGTSVASGAEILVPLVTQTNVLRARAFYSGLNPSVIVTSLYFRAAAAVAPIFDPPAGAFASSHVMVTITSGSAGALIRYTLDGTDPDEATPTSVTNGGVVTVAVPLEGTTLKARAFRTDLNPSVVSSAYYEPSDPVATPVFTPMGGQPTGTVQIACATAGATIRYTTDGSRPATDSLVVTNGGVVVVSVPGTLKARAWKTGMYASAIQTAYYGDFAGGSGTSPDPYQIATPEHLDNVRDHMSAAFVLVADIDLGVSPWNDGAGWPPIGALGNAFNGTMNGDGYVVRNLSIVRPGDEDIGLFGYAGSASQIINLGLVGGSVSGKNFVGGLVGYCEGAIASSFATCDVLGNIFDLTGGAGGLVGVGAATASLSNCYATGAVSGTWNLGGLLGYSQSSVSKCYAAGSVATAPDAGGMIGKYLSGTVAESYWDVEASGRTASGGGSGVEGKTTSEMQAQATFVGWDFAGVWGIQEATEYPVLQVFESHELSIPDAWLIQHYGSVDAAPAYSVKGNPLWWEYVAGTDPTDMGSVLAIDSIAEAGATLTLHVNSVTGRWYGVEARSNLMAGVWQTVGGVAEQPGTGAGLGFDLPLSWPTGFYRVTVRLDE